MPSRMGEKKLVHFSAYATLAPMSATPSYVGAMKIEPLQDSIHAPSLQHSNHPSGLDKLR